MFGIDPTVVGVRRSRLTYGVGVLHRFVPGKHPSSKKITRDNSTWCKDVFDRFVAVDQEVSRTSVAVKILALLAASRSEDLIKYCCAIFFFPESYLRPLK